MSNTGVKVIILLIITFITILSVSYYQTGRLHTITIESKERIVESSGEQTTSKYLVFTKDGRVFENTDDLWVFKFNSSNIQAKLKQDSTYTISTLGWRVPFLSMYQNIIEVK